MDTLLKMLSFRFSTERPHQARFADADANVNLNANANADARPLCSETTVAH
jgi:hypothetical protein